MAAAHADRLLIGCQGCAMCRWWAWGSLVREAPAGPAPRPPCQAPASCVPGALPSMPGGHRAADAGLAHAMDALSLQNIVHLTADAPTLAALACTCRQLRDLVALEARERGECRTLPAPPPLPAASAATAACAPLACPIVSTHPPCCLQATAPLSGVPWAWAPTRPRMPVPPRCWTAAFGGERLTASRAAHRSWLLQAAPRHSLSTPNRHASHGPQALHV